jgi:hypothetical protein
LTGQQPSADASVSALVEKCVAAAGAETESAVQRTRADLQAEIARFRERIAPLETELRTERDKAKTAHQQVETERSARTRAEAAYQQARDAGQKIAATFEAQLHILQVELDAERSRLRQLTEQLNSERAERAKFAAALQTVQRAVAFADQLAPAEESAAPAATAVDRAAPTHPAPTSTPERPQIESRESATNRSLKLVETATSEEPADPALVADADHLLAEIEVMYWADVESGRTPADLVDRLVANLRYTYDAFARRHDSAGDKATTLLERQIMKLLETKGEDDTSFARHLGIAAYEYAASSDSPSQHRAEAS